MGDMADDAFDKAMEQEYADTEFRRSNAELDKFRLKPISIAHRLIKWQTKDNRLIPVMDITDEHLRNLLRYLRNRSTGEKGEVLRYYNNWIDILSREQAYRKTKIAETIPVVQNVESNMLTWEELARIYNQFHPNTSRPAFTLPMEDVYKWAVSRTDLFKVVGDEGELQRIKPESNG